MSEEQEGPMPPEGKNKSLLYLGVAALIIVGIVLAVLFVPEHYETLDDLHVANVQGKLSPEEGYVYRGQYSFVRYQDSWYTQVTNGQGTLFSLAFDYGPRDLDDITIGGLFNGTVFNQAPGVIITSNLHDGQYQYLTKANAKVARLLTQAYGKQLVSACTSEHPACADLPIVDCDNTDEAVVYTSVENETAVLFPSENCVIITGDGEELIRATDRALYSFLGIMP